MLMEIDEVLVDSDEWEKVKAGDVEARQKLRKELNGLELYFHNLYFEGIEKTTPVTLRDLQEYNIVRFVKLESYDE